MIRVNTRRDIRQARDRDYHGATGTDGFDVPAPVPDEYQAEGSRRRLAKL
jgi:hypothetical protein